jgi:hypothetical protein
MAAGDFLKRTPTIDRDVPVPIPPALRRPAFFTLLLSTRRRYEPGSPLKPAYIQDTTFAFTQRVVK